MNGSVVHVGASASVVPPAIMLPWSRFVGRRPFRVVAFVLPLCSGPAAGATQPSANEQRPGGEVLQYRVEHDLELLLIRSSGVPRDASILDAGLQRRQKLAAIVRSVEMRKKKLRKRWQLDGSVALVGHPRRAT